MFLLGAVECDSETSTRRGREITAMALVEFKFNRNPGIVAPPPAWALYERRRRRADLGR